LNYHAFIITAFNLKVTFSTGEINEDQANKMKPKAIYWESGVPRKSDIITCLLAETQKQAEWENYNGKKGADWKVSEILGALTN
jgi:hypothetical protein